VQNSHFPNQEQIVPNGTCVLLGVLEIGTSNMNSKINSR